MSSSSESVSTSSIDLGRRVEGRPSKVSGKSLEDKDRGDDGWASRWTRNEGV